MQTRWSFYPAGSPNVVVTAFAAAGLLEAAGPCAPPRPRSPCGRGRPLGARGALDRAGGLLRLPPGPAREHPQRQPARRMARPCRPRAEILRPRLASPEPSSGRLPRSGRTARGPTGRVATLAWSDSFHSGYVLTCLDRLGGSRSHASRRRWRGAPSTTGGSSMRPDAPSSGRIGGFPRTATRRARRSRRSGRAASPRARRSRAARAGGARGCSTQGCGDGHAVHRRYRWGRTAGALLALV